jgi:pilus assembly protein CpaB
MSIRAFIVILLALVCGISAAAGIQNLRTDAPETTGETKAETVNVVVAAVDMQRGTPITDAMVYTRPWPKSEAPPDAIDNVEAVIGQTVSMPMLAGDVIVSKKMGVGRGLAALVKAGYRAFTISTPPTDVQAGFLLPGNRVDVLLTLKSQNRGANTRDNLDGMTVVLVGNVEIIASGKELSTPVGKENIENMQSVTLQVTPEEASLLSLGRQEGTLSLTLRNSADRGEAQGHIVKRGDFLRRIGVIPAEPVAKEQPKQEASQPIAAVKPKEPKELTAFTGTIEILRGTHRGRYYVTPTGVR